MAKRFLQMNGKISDQPDPKWDQHEAEKRGLIPAREPMSPVRSKPSQPDPRQEAILTSLGSLAFEEKGFSLEK